MDEYIVLSETLSKVTDKNLEGRVEYDRTSPVGIGGQANVYIGKLRPSGEFVAVKEVRVTAKEMSRMRKV